MAGPTRTPSQLAERVATNMNLLRPGETLSARYASQIEQAYAEAYAELLDDKLAYWPEAEIPLAVFQRVSWLVCIQVAPAFGALPVVLAAISQPNAEAARGEIREHLARHVAKSAHFETLRGEFI